MHTFIVSSAVNTKYGIFHSDQRFGQSLQTINSIRKFVPGAQIIWLEMSAEPLALRQKEKILGGVAYLIEYSGMPEVCDYYKINDHNIVKNLTEITCFYFGLKTAYESGWLANTERVFKLSGRYILSEFFNITDYNNQDLFNKYVFRQKLGSQFDQSITGGVSYQFMSRLWSFDCSLVNEVLDTFLRMKQDFIDRIKIGGYIDIEHLFFKFMPPEKIIEMPVVGVSGLLGPNGERVVE